MRYTVWSRGRQLGETDLGFVFRYNGIRCGWLHPTEAGDPLIPMATAVSPALRTLYTIGRDPTACADLCSAVDQEEALDLQLRSPDGVVIATEEIAIIDTHYLLSLAECDLHEDDTLDAEQEWETEALEGWSAEEPLEIELSPAEESEFPRYQIQVHLVDPDSVP
jgi:hypothetical protein